MSNKVFLIHGWSVHETSTYQAMHLQLAKHGFDLKEIYLGRYVSLDDCVEIRDIAKALHVALNKELNGDWSVPFHIVTHSTGALVSKHWILHHYIDDFCKLKPLKNIVFLAGPHFGSRLAHHGRSMLAHIKYLGDTGKEILRSLELGSEYSWETADLWMDNTNWKQKGIRPFNLIGDRVDRNSFAARIFPAAYERGSDMVVRDAAGNLNFKRFTFNTLENKLKRIGEVKDIPFGAMSAYTHSGDKTGDNNGIMNSIKKRLKPGRHEALKKIIDCKPRPLTQASRSIKGAPH